MTNTWQKVLKRNLPAAVCGNSTTINKYSCFLPCRAVLIGRCQIVIVIITAGHIVWIQDIAAVDRHGRRGLNHRENGGGAFGSSHAPMRERIDRVQRAGKINSKIYFFLASAMESTVGCSSLLHPTVDSTIRCSSIIKLWNPQLGSVDDQ